MLVATEKKVKYLVATASTCKAFSFRYSYSYSYYFYSLLLLQPLPLLLLLLLLPLIFLLILLLLLLLLLYTGQIRMVSQFGVRDCSHTIGLPQYIEPPYIWEDNTVFWVPQQCP